MSKVTLLSHTANPVETLYLSWIASRSNEPVPSMEKLKSEMEVNPYLKAEVYKTFNLYWNQKFQWRRTFKWCSCWKEFPLPSGNKWFVTG